MMFHCSYMDDTMCMQLEPHGHMEGMTHMRMGCEVSKKGNSSLGKDEQWMLFDIWVIKCSWKLQ